MEDVYPGLYVGSDEDYLRLADKPGWSYLRCCKDGPGGHRQLLGYETMAAPKDKNYYHVRRKHLLALNMIDGDDPNYVSTGMIDTALEFISERLAAGDRVLVSCNQGHSRGPSVAMMYLRSIGELPHPFLLAERVFRTLYPYYQPALGARQYAKSNWSRLEPRKDN